MCRSEKRGLLVDFWGDLNEVFPSNLVAVTTITFLGRDPKGQIQEFSKGETSYCKYLTTPSGYKSFT